MICGRLKFLCKCNLCAHIHLCSQCMFSVHTDLFSLAFMDPYLLFSLNVLLIEPNSTIQFTPSQTVSTQSGVSEHFIDMIFNVDQENVGYKKCIAKYNALWINFSLHSLSLFIRLAIGDINILMYQQTRKKDKSSIKHHYTNMFTLLQTLNTQSNMSGHELTLIIHWL